MKEETPEQPLQVIIVVGRVFLFGILALAVFPAMRPAAFYAAAGFTVAVALFGIVIAACESVIAGCHRRLAVHGEAVVGTVTQLTLDYATENFNKALVYEFCTRSGQKCVGKREHAGALYGGLVQDGPVVIIYLPEAPEKNEPYDNLQYRVAEEEPAQETS